MPPPGFKDIDADPSSAKDTVVVVPPPAAPPPLGDPVGARDGLFDGDCITAMEGVDDTDSPEPPLRVEVDGLDGSGSTLEEGVSVLSLEIEGDRVALGVARKLKEEVDDPVGVPD